MNQPRVEDYVLSFESPGLTPFFQEIVCRFYMPFDSFLLSKENLTQSFISRKTMREMEKTGEEYFSTVKNIEAAWRKLEALFREMRAFLDLAADDHVFTPDDIEKIYRIMGAIHEEYMHFGHGFTDTVYELVPNEPKIREALEFVEKYKNEIRETYNELFFTQDTGMPLFLTKLPAQLGISTDELLRYRKDEIFSMLEGQELSPATIEARKLAYVFWKTENSITFLEGKVASDFIDAFGSVIPQENVTIIKGIVANHGPIIRGAVRIINSDYTNPQSVESKMDVMQKGEILVASTTAPDLMRACRKAAAIVTDVGGVLSHGAIISRELKIPGIVDTQFASKILKDGDMIEVDTEKGIVRIL